QERGLEDMGFEQRLMQLLERSGELDRAVEFLPDDIEVADRRRRSQALTRPELAVLLAYAKLSLNHDLVQSSVPDDPYLGRELGRYFPKAIAEKFPDALEQHRLRREIISTQLANSMINRGGPSLVVRIADQTGASVARIAAAFAAVRDSYGMTALNSDIDALDTKISGHLQLELYRAIQDLLLDRLVWFLRNVELAQGLAAILAHYREGITAVEAALDTALPHAAAGGGRGCAQRARDRPAQAGRPGRVGAPPRRAADACRSARHRHDRRPHRAEHCRGHGDLFRGRGVFPSRSHHQRRSWDRHFRLFRPACARPRARFDWGGSAAARCCNGEECGRRAYCGRGLGRAAQERGRAHPPGDPRDRPPWGDLCQNLGGGQTICRICEKIAAV